MNKAIKEAAAKIGLELKEKKKIKAETLKAKDIQALTLQMLKDFGYVE